MASEDRLRELEEKYEDYKVYDNRGERIGKVDDLFVDESDREEYIGVKMGFFGMKSTLIPMDIVQWANDGALPFLSLRSLSRSVLEKADASSMRFPDALLEPTGRWHSA